MYSVATRKPFGSEEYVIPLQWERTLAHKASFSVALRGLMERIIEHERATCSKNQPEKKKKKEMRKERFNRERKKYQMNSFTSYSYLLFKTIRRSSNKEEKEVNSSLVQLRAPK